MTNKTERKILGWFILVVILLTSVPYIIGFASQTKEWRFSGFLVGVEDGNSYIAKMLRGSVGDNLFRSPFTVAPQDGLLVFLPYLWIGKLASPPAQHTQLVALFQLFRCLGIFVYVIGIHRFIRIFPLSTVYRLFATGVATLGAGAGWVMLFFEGNLPGDGVPLEFLSPETFGFLSVFTLPHLAMGIGFFFLSLSCFFKVRPAGNGMKVQTRQIFFGGIYLFIVGLMQSIYVAIGFLILGIYYLNVFIQNKKQIKETTIIMGMSILSLLPALGWVIYMLVQSVDNPFLRGWNEQSIVLAQPPIYYFFSFGVFYLFILINYNKLRVAINTPSFRTILICMIIFPFLVILPVNFQRRLALGIWIMVIVLALFIIQKLSKKTQYFANIAFVLIVLPSTLIILITSIGSSRNLASPTFTPVEYVNIYNRLGSLDGEKNVLTIFRTGNELPAWTASNVTLGLGSESVKYDYFENQAELFYRGNSTTVDRTKLIEEFNVRYAILGDRERQAVGQDLMQIPGSKVIFSSGSVSLLEIIP